MNCNFTFKKAKWIWLENRKVNHYAEFSRKFEFYGGSAEIFISAKTDYALYLNGKFIDCGQYCDFPELKSVDRIDVSEYLKKGANELFILARSMDADTFSHIKNGHGIIFEIVSENAVVICSDENVLSRESVLYESGKTYEITPQIGFGYVCNINSENPYEFTRSKIVDCNAKFFIRPINKLRLMPVGDAAVTVSGSYILGDGAGLSEKLQTAFLSFDALRNDRVLHKTRGDGVYFIVDLKRERSGFLDFELDLSSDADIVVTFGEHLKDLRVRHRIAEMDFVLYHKGKKGLNSFTSYLRRIGGRYLQFFVSADAVEIKKASLIETVYPIKENKAATDDYLMRKIWDVSVNTLKQCMHEHYEDCPWREQAQYGTDGFLQILSGFYAFSSQEFARESLLLMGHEVNKYGFLCLTSPCRQELFIPSFSMSYIQAVYEYFKMTNDVGFLTESAPTVERLLDNFISHIDESGLIKRFDAWNFYEWTDGLCHFEEKGYHAPLNAMLYACLKSWVKTVSAVKGSGRKREYEKIADSVRNSLENNFWDDDRGVYATYLVNGQKEHYAEYTQAVMLWSGCCDKTRSKIISDVLMCGKNDLVKLSLSNNYFKYEGLLRADKDNIGYVFSDIKERWSKMLFDGATSFWETEEGENAFGKAGSLCHGWSAIPVYFMGKYSLLQ